jgi:5'-3' exoribonuclease 1
MTSPASPILDFFPGAFAVDMEGKRAEWEGIVLIPFIDEACLLAAEGRIPRGALTPEERARNAPGEILIYSHDPAAGPEGAPP